MSDNFFFGNNHEVPRNQRDEWTLFFLDADRTKESEQSSEGVESSRDYPGWTKETYWAMNRLHTPVPNGQISFQTRAGSVLRNPANNTHEGALRRTRSIDSVEVETGSDQRNAAAARVGRPEAENSAHQTSTRTKTSEDCIKGPSRGKDESTGENRSLTPVNRRKRV